MSTETEFNKIIRKTGMKPFQCKCQTCKKQCVTSPCLGTPDDIEKIIDAGHGDKIKHTDWMVGIVHGFLNHSIPMMQASFDENGCVFFENGLCKLHNSGLKPTEGKLTNHNVREVRSLSKSLAYQVAKTWEDEVNQNTIERINSKLENLNKIV